MTIFKHATYNNDKKSITQIDLELELKYMYRKALARPNT